MTQPYATGSGWTIYHGDLRDVLPQLSGAALIMADPTYQQTVLAWDRWVPGWPALALASLAPAGSMWCWGSLRMFMDRAADYGAWALSHDIVWEKHNGSGLHADRFRRVHDQSAHFYPRAARWGDVYRDPQYTMDARARTVRRKMKPAHYGAVNPGTYTSEDGGPRMMRSVIHHRSMHGRARNPTEKPVGLLRPLIRYGCPPGRVVVAPFMGSGSDLEAAMIEGRVSIGIDIRESECESAARRLESVSMQAELAFV